MEAMGMGNTFPRHGNHDQQPILRQFRVCSWLRGTEAWRPQAALRGNIEPFPGACRARAAPSLQTPLGRAGAPALRRGDGPAQRGQMCVCYVLNIIIFLV